MNVISSHPYIKIEREIKGNQQCVIKTKKWIILYQNKIETASQLFWLKDVFDISFKSLGDNDGFLYLHTSKGLFPYQVDADPTHLIDEFKRMHE